ncbi:GNAT family N-acetyltransferase [Actinocorallia lasiicapitis]
MTLRALGPDDLEAVRAMHDRCSLESRRMRYFSAKPDLPQRLFQRFLERSRGCTLVIEDSRGAIVALGHLMYTAPGQGELAFLVEDAWQGRGLGRGLAERLCDLGNAEGLTELTASVLSENIRMRSLLTSLGGTTRRSEDPAVLEITVRVARAVVAA